MATPMKRKVRVAIVGEQPIPGADRDARYAPESLVSIRAAVARALETVPGLCRPWSANAVRVLDPLEMHIPDIGLVTLEDAETGRQTLIDAGDRHHAPCDIRPRPGRAPPSAPSWR